MGTYNNLDNGQQIYIFLCRAVLFYTRCMVYITKLVKRSVLFCVCVATHSKYCIFNIMYLFRLYLLLYIGY